MEQYLQVDKEGRSYPLHAVLGVADGVNEFIPEESKTYVVHVKKGWYHKTKTRGGVLFEVEVEFKMEVGYHMKIIISLLPPF